MDQPLRQIAVLFAREDSIYNLMPGCDVYNKQRDARSFTGRMPVIAHPPCRGWGRMRHWAKPDPDEKDLALFAVDVVRREGGVLEHPAYSTLWQASGLPLPDRTDDRGGYTIAVQQFWWGHRAMKPTWLYICKIKRSLLPDVPVVTGSPTHCIARRRGSKLIHCTHAEREHTPQLFAQWLCRVARLVER